MEVFLLLVIAINIIRMIAENWYDHDPPDKPPISMWPGY